MATRKKPETEAQLLSKKERRAMPKEAAKSISLNEEALVSLVFHASGARIESLFRELRRTLKRLGVSTTKKVSQLSVGEETGNFPNLLDVIRWLDDQDEKSQEIDFIVALYQIADSRVSPSFRKKLILEED